MEAAEQKEEAFFEDDEPEPEAPRAVLDALAVLRGDGPPLEDEDEIARQLELGARLATTREEDLDSLSWLGGVLAEFLRQAEKHGRKGFGREFVKTFAELSPDVPLDDPAAVFERVFGVGLPESWSEADPELAVAPELADLAGRAYALRERLAAVAELPAEGLDAGAFLAAALLPAPAPVTRMTRPARESGASAGRGACDILGVIRLRVMWVGL